MELRVLRYFLTVAEEENITRAAELMHMTQPTLSRQLIQLEEELGVQLFRRSRHKVILTEEGLLLKRRARELVTLADKTKAELRQAEEISGEIAIGCGETGNMSFLSEGIRRFREMHPQVSFRIYSANADDVKERMERGLLDLGLLMEPVDVSRYEFVRMPEKERWGVLVPRDWPITRQETVRPEDLAGMPLILPSRESVAHELASWFGKTGDGLEAAARYNLLLNAANMARHHVGAVVCMDLGICYEGLEFLPLWPLLETGSVLVWKKGQAFSPAALRFMDFLKNTN